ncbi:MAG: ATP-binding cassette domain-containing protein [Desulfobacterales bacterium]|nr:MAG: ATP-binding cassette domain-containing protein [Desulfobacterales bacterium]
MASELIRLSDYMVEALADENGLRNFNLILERGDACSIVTDSPDAARHLLRALATLEPPKSGRFFYKGEELDLSDYRKLLRYKRKAGYIAPDATFIINRSMRDNLMLMRYYFEDSTTVAMPVDLMELCRIFELEKKLDVKPHQLDPEEQRLFVIVRELSKDPDIVLIDRPRAFLRTKSFEALKSILRDLIKKGLALMFFSADKSFTHEFSNKRITIDRGKVTSFASGEKVA